MMRSATRLLAIPLTVLLAGAVPEYKVDWATLDDAVSRYLRDPTSGTAEEVTRLLPPGVADRHVGVFDVDTSERIFQQLDALDGLVKRGHPEAVDVAFALISISDGHFTESLLTMIASSLDVEPVIFLSALNRNRSRLFASCELAYDTGLDYVDDPKAELKVLERRLEKVQHVRAPEFEKEKKCVAKALGDTITAIRKNTK